MIAVYGDRLVMEENLETALSVLFGGRIPKAAAPGTVAAGPVREETVGSLAARAMNHYNQAQSYLRQGNWGAYGDELKKLEGVLREMSKK
ncbi:MAG: hypothetical protein HY760_09120 [Nitrospirae bacterium]|nr:hypothetical protein [Nitrospirota bacterium]